MLGRKVVKGKQDFFIFLEAFARFWEFALLTGNELIVGCQSRLASWCQVHFMDQLLGFCLNALGHFIKDIGRLMHPATLLGDWRYSSCRAIQKPSEPSPSASFGVVESPFSADQ
jgi:hypothetical protein